MAGRKKVTSTPAARKTQSKKTTESSVVYSRQKPQSGGILDYFRFGESYTSLVLGIVVVIIASILLISFLRGKSAEVKDATQQTSSARTSITPQQETESSTYTVKAGDDLWSIAEREFNDGFRWTEIAMANNIDNASFIEAGTNITIPQKENVRSTNPAASPTVTEQNEKVATQSSTPTPTPILAQQSQPTQEKITANAYTVRAGDDLWDIAVRAYGDGYQWVRIARANNLVNPDIIHVGNQLALPR